MLAAQVLRDVVVLAGQSRPDVEHEDHCVGLGHRLASLLGHLGDDAGRLLRFEAAGVDDDEFARAEAGVPVVAVAGQAGEVGHDRVAALRDAVEQRRLADVRPPDERDDRFHRGLKAYKPPPAVVTSSVSPDSTGVPTTALPSVASRNCCSPLAAAMKCT